MRLIPITCLFFIIFSTLPFAQSPQRLNDSALEKAKAGNYAGAVADLETARMRAPSEPAVKQNLAYVFNAWAVELGRAGDYEQAVEKLGKAVELAPENTPIRKNLAVLRANWAQALMDQGKNAEAEQQLTKAYADATPAEKPELDKRRSNNLLLLARADRVKSQDEPARHHLEQALKIDPKNVAALVDLGQLLYEQGDSSGALDEWMQAEKLRPDAPGLAGLIDKVSREVLTEDGFRRKDSDKFTVSYEGRVAEPAAREALDILNRAHREIGQLLGAYPKKKIAVVLYSRDQYTSATDAPHWTGGLYDGKIRVPLDNDMTNATRESLRQTLYHEYTHALITDLAGPSVPSWFNEGLANYNELDTDARQRRYERERRRVAGMEVAAQLPAMSSLPVFFSTIQNPFKVEEAYLVSRTFVAWLAERYRPTRFKTVLDALGEGSDLEAAIEKAYNKPLPRLESEWHTSLKGM